MSCPTAIGAKSTWIGAPAAIVAASGSIWETSGQSVATPPTAAAAPVATKRKSRRVEPAEDAVVTFPNPFPSCSRSNCLQERPYEPEEAAGARDPRGGMNRLPTYFGRTDCPESFYWHPCPESASPLSADKRAMH